MIGRPPAGLDREGDVGASRTELLTLELLDLQVKVAELRLGVASRWFGCGWLGGCSRLGRRRRRLGVGIGAGCRLTGGQNGDADREQDQADGTSQHDRHDLGGAPPFLWRAGWRWLPPRGRGGGCPHWDGWGAVGSCPHCWSLIGIASSVRHPMPASYVVPISLPVPTGPYFARTLGAWGATECAGWVGSRWELTAAAPGFRSHIHGQNRLPAGFRRSRLDLDVDAVPGDAG